MGNYKPDLSPQQQFWAEVTLMNLPLLLPIDMQADKSTAAL